ncbi:hypothetical protein A9Q99_25645 [Gammaproteobacteria bacterium 45_16_T64]|nr:hypothetical protein A9Q99_25645 [Gammaproteobacteria bacterium 45_16_T64]
MKRNIVGFHLDEEGDWVAELDCYHGQHVRHAPPFIMRPWVTTEEGRQDKIGEALECVRCDALEFPEDLVPYKKTAEFTEITIPKGFQKDHSTKEGTWGVIKVLQGTLMYTVNYPTVVEHEIIAGQQGIIPPCLLHSVRAQGPVVFFVEFYSK